MDALSAMHPADGDEKTYRPANKEDVRKQRELEEARKAGTVLPEVDEEGKMINPHIPSYIAKVPWYYAADRPTLRHQKAPQASSQLDKLKKQLAGHGKKPALIAGCQSSVLAGRKETGCTNCGEPGHLATDCLERPRKIGAAAKRPPREANAAAHEAIMHTQKEDATYDSKRDKWEGYAPEEYIELHQNYEKMEEMMLRKKESEVKAQLTRASQAPGSLEEAATAELDKDMKYADDAEMVGSKFDSKKRISTRNLRIREDRAKYLINLDLNSAYYDPKTRSMRQDPYLGLAKRDPNYVAEKFVRQSGDALAVAQAQLFAWHHRDDNKDFSLLANPTASERTLRQLDEEKQQHAEQISHLTLERYGASLTTEAPPPELAETAQTTAYLEYDLQGNLVHDLEPAVPRSKYMEDVLFGNHTEIFGSYYEAGSWGYACCCSLNRNAYCTGSAGRALHLSELASQQATRDSSSKSIDTISSRFAPAN